MIISTALLAFINGSATLLMLSSKTTFAITVFEADSNNVRIRSLGFRSNLKSDKKDKKAKYFDCESHFGFLKGWFTLNWSRIYQNISFYTLFWAIPAIYCVYQKVWYLKKRPLKTLGKTTCHTVRKWPKIIGTRALTFRSGNREWHSVILWILHTLPRSRFMLLWRHIFQYPEGTKHS